MTYDIVGVLIDDNNIGLYIRPTSSLVECYLQLILRAQLATLPPKKEKNLKGHSLIKFFERNYKI